MAAHELYAVSYTHLGGMIIDTILQALATALAGAPAAVYTTFMYIVLGLLSLLVPSSSGLAALTMPVDVYKRQVMSRVVLRDAGVHLAAIAMALKLASAGLDDLCYRLEMCIRDTRSRWWSPRR